MRCPNLISWFTGCPDCTDYRSPRKGHLSPATGPKEPSGPLTLKPRPPPPLPKLARRRALSSGPVGRGWERGRQAPQARWAPFPNSALTDRDIIGAGVAENGDLGEGTCLQVMHL